MSIASDVQSLDPGALVELFVLDATSLGGAVNYFHAGTNEIKSAVVWQGNAYQPWPIKATGFEVTTQGQLPRPKLSISNVLGTIGALVRDYGDLLNAVLTRKRTFARYLDAENFAGGVNDTADPTAAFPDDIYIVDRKTTESKTVIEFELAAKMDMEGVRVPLRVVTQTCPWAYRGTECGYSGGPVADATDTATGDPTKDACGKRLTSCKLRFPNLPLPFGGWPASQYLK